MQQGSAGRSKILTTSGNAVLWINQCLWTLVPESFRQSRLGLLWGRAIFRITGLRKRRQLTTTWFFRNRPELAQLAELVQQMPDPGTLRMTVVGCSEGAEVYSILYILSKTCADLPVKLQAYDICEEALMIARGGRYSSADNILSLTRDHERDELFDKDNDELVIKQQFRDQVEWQSADPTREPVLSRIEKQDIVIANRLLFHMPPDEQYRVLQVIADMVRPGGYLFVSGLDLQVRTDLAKKRYWQPVTDNIEAIHSADSSMTRDWPFRYWGLEPFDKKHPDWSIRYCSIFRMPIEKPHPG